MDAEKTKIGDIPLNNASCRCGTKRKLCALIENMPASKSFKRDVFIEIGVANLFDVKQNCFFSFNGFCSYDYQT